MPRRHALLASLVAVVWGVNFVVIHAGLRSFPPLLFAALRFTLVAFPAVLLVRRPPVPLRWVLGVGAFLSAGQFGLLFVAMDRGMPAGLASLVLQTQALFTIALGVLLLGERPGRRVLAGAAIAFAGIAIIGAGRAEAVPLAALLLCIGAGASWGVGNICTRRAQAPDALALLVWSSLVPPLPLLGLSLALEGPAEIGGAFSGLTVGGLAALAYVVVLSTFFGFGTWTWLIRRHAVNRVAPFTLLVPPVGIGAAWVLLGERPTATEVAGALVVLVGLAVVQTRAGIARYASARRRMPSSIWSAVTPEYAMRRVFSPPSRRKSVPLTNATPRSAASAKSAPTSVPSGSSTHMK
jgi:O-acetylserine/cysteine efflux transporter